MPEGKVRVVIVGAGRMASSIDDEISSMDTWPSLKQQLPYSHAPCYKRFDGVEIVAVADLVEEKCVTFCKRWDVPNYYLDYREMIRSEKPQILSITTPATTHAEIALFAMDHGVRGVYCEKAMCCSLAEADAIVRSVRKHNVAFMLGAQRRHHPNFKKAREIAHSGEIGGLIGVNSWIESSLLHSLSHTVDGSLFLAGDAAPVSVFGVLGGSRSIDDIEARRASLPDYDPASHRWKGDPGCSTYTARLDNGLFLIHLPAVTDVRWEVVCSNGYIRILDNNDTLHVYRRRGRTYSFDAVDLAPIPRASSHLALVRDLIDCVATGRKPLGNEAAGLHGMEILVGAAQSHLEGGCMVALPLSDREMYVPSY